MDLLCEGRVSQEHVERGFKDGIRNGLITAAEAKKAKSEPEQRRLIGEWLKESV
jgi:hypothetical protein